MFSFERAVTNRRKEWTAAATVAAGYMSAEASKDAAKTAATGRGEAAMIQKEAGEDAREYQEKIYRETQDSFSPYVDAGRQGINQYMSESANQFGLPEYQQPTEADMKVDPGYQFRLDQGMEATTRALTKSGQAWGGQRGIALMDYAQKSASQEYQNVFNRSIQNYGLQYQRRSDYLNRLQGLSEQGRASVGALGQIGSGTAANVGNTIMSTGQGMAQQTVGAANATAAGQIGQARGYSQMLEGLGMAGTMYAGGGQPNNWSGIGGVYQGSQQDRMLANQNQGLY